MEYYEQIDYNNIIDTLLNTFGEVLSRDVIYSIVESYEGNLEESANAVMNIIMDDEATVTNEPHSVDTSAQAILTSNLSTNQENLSGTPPTTDSHIVENVQTISYANASRVTKPPVYQGPKSSSSIVVPNNSQNFYTDQVKQIITHHENGACTLILMRGVSGSGKSYLAKKIIDSIYCATNQYYCTHIFSTDDFFMQNNVYKFDNRRLSEAHEWNKMRARKAIIKGVSPVIIDNTNIEIWEMEFYVAEGVKNGYLIEVLEPNTPWARKAYQLSKKTAHNVPIETIRRKLDNFQSVTSEDLLKEFRLQYSSFNSPPILRKIPPFLLQQEDQPVSENHKECESVSTNEVKNSNHENSQCSSTDIQQSEETSTISGSNVNITPEESKSLQSIETDLGKVPDLNQLSDLQKCLEEMEKVEKEWDNGDEWEDNSQNKIHTVGSSESCNSKPQRQNKFVHTDIAKDKDSLLSLDICQDWSKCTMFLPPWGETSTHTESPVPAVETRSTSTCVEYGDTDLSSPKKPLKIYTAVPRNINEYHIETHNKKIPVKYMLDKSTSTNGQILTDTPRCKNEEQHFKVFRRLFKTIAKSELRDIFETCDGDVNWAVGIVLDSMANNALHVIDSNDGSDSETETQDDNVEEVCHCLSRYEIIPDQELSVPQPLTEENETCLPSTLQTKKVKKENIVSETSLQLKRQIEQNVVISNNHYSEHCLKIRKIRRGELNIHNTDESISDLANTKHEVNDINIASTSESLQPSPCHSYTPSTSKMAIDYTETNSEDSFSVDEIEKTVNINLGKEFVTQLDELFGRSNMEYPPNVIPRINIPMSILNEINALWMESLMHQVEEDAKQSEIMVQQDEEFARQLANKEAELIRAGTEPEVPDFKEIMDMDFALSLYHKDVAEWRNNVPDDLAAKLSRDKLYNLFPDVSPDILSELLMAHDNNFQGTVEVLLMSTGKTDILTKKNGVSKFVMEKELERQEKLLQEEREKSISEVEWPLLPQTGTVEMAVVEQYRADADKHLKLRNKNYQKAEEYIRRNIPSAATYYSDVAAFHKRQFELANSMAAASLMQVHASNSSDNATIDLHYLRVGEAKESLDLFLDTHIQKLKQSQDRNGVKYHTLYFITGRGLHSNGRPRIKPAIKKRLEERRIRFSERNPGLLTAKVCADDILSYQVT